MKPILIAVALLIPSARTRASANSDVKYAEPKEGVRVTIDNMKNRKRLLGTDWYCVRDILIDGAKVFGGNHCRIKHASKHAVLVSPGTHAVVFDTISEWGADYDPDLPPMQLSTTIDAVDKDIVVLLRDALPPEILALEASDKPLLSPSSSTVASPAGAAPSVSTVSAAAGAPSGDPYKALERLKELYDKGVITGDEFKEKKTELLKTIR